MAYEIKVFKLTTALQKRYSSDVKKKPEGAEKPSTSFRLGEETRKRLREIAEADHRTQAGTLAWLIDRRWEELNSKHNSDG